MRFNEFKDVIKNSIIDYLPDDVAENVEIDDAVVVKMNDQKQHGIIIREKGSDVAPTLYVDEMFQRYCQGEDLGSLMVELANQYSFSRDMPKPPEVDLSWDKVKKNLTIRLIEKKRNHEFLATMPYLGVGNGLAIIADINGGVESGGEWRIAVNNCILASLEVDKETLFDQAMKNSMRMAPAILNDMSNALFSPERVNLLDRDEPLAPEEIGGMYILTNESGSLGAATLFYPDVKEKAAELLGSGYYILPSSVHETILVPDNPEINARDLCDMVKQANRTVVDEKDILSDDPLYYNKTTGELKKVDACVRNAMAS